ncbi:MAG: DMT family transporter [Microcoleaceae cyanobacterium]
MSETQEKIINLTEANLGKFSSLIPFFFLTGALLAISMAPIFMKLSFREISANATLYNRLWIGAVIFGLWSGFNQLGTKKIEDQPSGERKPHLKDFALLFAASIFQLLNRLFFIWSLTQTSAANATILGSLTPISTTLGAWLLFKQRFDRQFIVGLVLATVGAMGLGWQDFQQSSNSFLGDSAALIAAFLYTGTLLTLENIRDKFSVINILLWRCVIGTLLILPLVLLFDEPIYPISLSGWLSVIALSAVCEALGHGLLVYSLNHFSAAFITVFFLLDPVIVAILAWIIFAESLSLLNLIVFTVILSGVYLAISGKVTTQEESEYVVQQ